MYVIPMLLSAAFNDLINDAVIRRGTVYPVPVRITDVKGGSRFGMQESDDVEIIKNRASYERIRIAGVHYFTGTQKRIHIKADDNLSAEEKSGLCAEVFALPPIFWRAMFLSADLKPEIRWRFAARVRIRLWRAWRYFSAVKCQRSLFILKGKA